jgi:hypothetical protein
MKTSFLIVTTSLAALCGGCAGTGPNTEQGAVIGGATGAVAGAIVGNNSGGGGHAVGGALIGGAVGAVAGGAIGNNLDHQRGTIYTSENEATTNVVVREAPPPPPRRVEARRDRDRHPEGAVWVNGYWAYTGGGNNYTWVEGHWETPPQRYRTYVEPHWARRGDGYVYIQGYWH